MAKNKSVFGIYISRSAVESAITHFREAGFASTDVSVLLPENLGSKELGTHKATKAPKGTAAGATSGAVIGGALGWLVGMGALAIPGLGPFIAAGPIMAALAGVGVGGAVGGFTVLLSDSVFPNTKPSAMRVGYRKAESSCLCTATPRKKLIARRKF